MFKWFRRLIPIGHPDDRLDALQTPPELLPDQSALPEGWDVCDSGFFAAEALNEIKKGHDLWGRSFRTLARRAGNDDTLFADAATLELFVIHLTYSANQCPPWPSYHRLTNLSELENF